MITLNESGDTLHVTIRGVFDFEASRTMLRKFKTHTQHRNIRKIDVSLKQITFCNSFAIGSLIILAKKAGDGFNIVLDECNEDIHQLFDSGFLDRFFQSHPATHARHRLPCARCYKKDCTSSGAGCRTHRHPSTQTESTAWLPSDTGGNFPLDYPPYSRQAISTCTQMQKVIP